MQKMLLLSAFFCCPSLESISHLNFKGFLFLFKGIMEYVNPWAKSVKDFKQKYWKPVKKIYIVEF